MDLWPVARRRERVRVEIARVGSFEAKVVRSVDGAAELSLRTPAPVPARFLHRIRARATPLAGSGEVHGRLLALTTESGNVREDRMHFLAVGVPGIRPPARVQRRDHARIPVVAPVLMLPSELPGRWVHGFVHNVSAGGVLVAGAGDLLPGERLRLRLELEALRAAGGTPADLPLELMARVVRAEPGPSGAHTLSGLELLGLDDATREELVRFVFARQREDLARLARRAG